MLGNYLQKQKMVSILDPGICTRNAGDEIISQAVREQIVSLFPDNFLTMLPTHDRIGMRSHRLIIQSELCIVGGSNILTSRMFGDRQWRIGLTNAPFVKNLVLLGVGWREYEKTPTWYTKALLRRLLSRDHLHSVRDEHTKGLLHSAGFDNVEMTSCVTMWNLTPEHLAKIPKHKGKVVLTTINMEKSSLRDVEILKILSEQYEEVYIWPQGLNDRDYIKDIAPSNAKIIGGNLEAFDAILESPMEVDYCGSRLHGGIRSLQKGRRALIFSIDNRAAEIARDTGLPAIPRTSSDEEIVALLNDAAPITINLPTDAIERWRSSVVSRR